MGTRERARRVEAAPLPRRPSSGPVHLVLRALHRTTRAGTRLRGASAAQAERQRASPMPGHGYAQGYAHPAASTPLRTPSRPLCARARASPGNGARWCCSARVCRVARARRAPRWPGRGGEGPRRTWLGARSNGARPHAPPHHLRTTPSQQQHHRLARGQARVTGDGRRDATRATGDGRRGRASPSARASEPSEGSHRALPAAGRSRRGDRDGITVFPATLRRRRSRPCPEARCGGWGCVVGRVGVARSTRHRDRKKHTHSLTPMLLAPDQDLAPARVRA